MKRKPAKWTRPTDYVAGSVTGTFLGEPIVHATFTPAQAFARNSRNLWDHRAAILNGRHRDQARIERAHAGMADVAKRMGL